MLCLVQVGEYVGTVQRAAEADSGSDPYNVRYPDAGGELRRRGSRETKPAWVTPHTLQVDRDPDPRSRPPSP